MEWTFEENKLFENAIAEFDHNSSDIFRKIASRVPGKTIDQIIEHCKALVDDVDMIEQGLVPLPDYKDAINNDVIKWRNNSGHRSRRKAIPWTKEEHENFLSGLAIYGKGDWRSISRNCVRTRTPTQVASHAQKHFIRIERDSIAHQNVNSTPRSTDQPHLELPCI